MAIGTEWSMFLLEEIYPPLNMDGGRDALWTLIKLGACDLIAIAGPGAGFPLAERDMDALLFRV
jgi:hypothetical protein